MKLFTGLTAICLWALTSALQQEQFVLHDEEPKPLNVAIIGAGAGGASSAYYLAKFAHEAGISVNITVFERNDYIGGRSTTVNVYDDSSIPVELGASIFVEVNEILVNATRDFNLSTEALISRSKVPGAALAVWDGQQFVFTQTGEGGWWDSAKLLWKYGLVPIRTMRLVKSVVGKFLQMYHAPAFPFTSLTQVAQDLGLAAVTAATGEQYLEESGITGAFGREIVQASTRVNYAQNLHYIHGLEAMVSMAAEKARSIQGGNWQIFDRMIKTADAKVLLGTQVSEVKRSKGSYLVKSRRVGADTLTHSVSQAFDEVILAAPAQFADIDMSDVLDNESQPDKIPYVELYVTLFTSPHLLSPKRFNLSAETATPRVILTTLPDGEKPQTGPASEGSPGFYSISLLQTVTNPKTGKEEYLYKIFSGTGITSLFLSELFDVQIDIEKAALTHPDITWGYRKVWNSYPYEYPRVTFEKVRLDDGLWYTSGMDSLISTMETNALMGMNVARLIIDEQMEKGPTVEMRRAVEGRRARTANNAGHVDSHGDLR